MFAATFAVRDLPVPGSPARSIPLGWGMLVVSGLRCLSCSRLMSQVLSASSPPMSSMLMSVVTCSMALSVCLLVLILVTRLMSSFVILPS